MLIYEKNNKLNINFDNEVSEQPDLQISKEDGKTSVTVDGQPSGGGSGSGPLLVNIVPDQEYPDWKLVMDKTIGEIKEAFASGRNIVCKRDYALTNKDTGETISFSEYGLVLSIWPFESVIFVGSGNINYGSFEPMKFSYDFDDNSYPFMITLESS